MSLTRIGSIGINTGIAFAGVTTIVTLNTANDALSIGATVNVGSGITLGASGDIFATGVSTFSGNLKVGSGVTISPDGDGFYTGVVTATTFSGALAASNLTGALPAISGANLTNLDASDLASGTVPTARLGSGTASSSTFLRGDSTFAAVTSTTINSNADNRIITGSGTANTLNGESTLTYDGTNLDLNADNKKLRLGTGNDMLLYHDGTKSRIHSASHDISIRSGGVFGVYNGDGTEEMILATPDGAVELYHNNVKKLNTNANGLAVHGGTHFNSSAVTGTPLTYLYGYAGTDAKGVTIENIEAGLELISNANGNHSSSILLRNLNDGFAIINDNDANSLQIRYFTAVSNDFNAHGNGNGLSKLETSAVFNEDGAVQLYNNNVLKFDTVSTGIRVHGSEGGDAQIQLLADEGDDNADYWRILAGSAGQLDVANYSTGSWVNHMTIKGNGNVTHANQACMVFGNAIDVSTPSNSTPLQFSGLEVSKGGMSESNSRSRITVPTTGTYLIYAMLSGSISSAASTDGVEITILKNGSVYPNVYNHPISSYGVNAGDEFAFQLTQVLNVSANDYLEVCLTNINTAVAALERGHFAVSLLH